ncbi:PucR family transcriptional regulator [Streptomyces tanashiensis]
MYEGPMPMTPSPSPEAGSTPPAPPVPLAALLARTDLGLRLLAGPEDVPLHWVHTSEMADPYPYLLGGELLMTAGVRLTDPAHYVERVVEAGAAALAFGVTPVYDTVPAELVEACARHGLPLVEVPPRTPFTAVARALWRLMAEARLHELRRVTEAQQSLAAAAARQAPVPAVLGALASRLGGRAVLFGADGTESAAAGREVPAEAARALRDLAGVLGPRPGGPASASGDGGGLRLAAYALGGGDGLTLGVATERRGPGDHTIAGVAVVLLSLLTAPHRGADVPYETGPWCGCCSARPRRMSRAPWARSPGRWCTRGAATAPRSRRRAWRRSSGRRWWPTTEAPYGSSCRPPPRSPRRRGWTLGASAPGTASELGAGEAQAARALRRAEASRAALVRRAGGFAALVDRDEAAAYAREVLAPLGEPLVETLRAWLSLHGSWDRTAVALEIHRNTVRQRIARCAALLDRDLDDPDVRMELWFALR